jgi:hypothetical protein
VFSPAVAWVAKSCHIVTVVTGHGLSPPLPLQGLLRRHGLCNLVVADVVTVAALVVGVMQKIPLVWETAAWPCPACMIAHEALRGCPSPPTCSFGTAHLPRPLCWDGLAVVSSSSLCVLVNFSWSSRSSNSWPQCTVTPSRLVTALAPSAASRRRRARRRARAICSAATSSIATVTSGRLHACSETQKHSNHPDNRSWHRQLCSRLPFPL